MKCISLWQPWATLIVIGAKRFETRSWETSYRGPLLIHAAKKRDVESLRMCLEEPFRTALLKAGVEKIGDIPLGKILGVTTLDTIFKTGQVSMRQTRAAEPYSLPLPDSPERDFGDYYPGRFAWRLKDEKQFASPIPYSAFQGIFNVPEEVVAEQLATAQKMEAA